MWTIRKRIAAVIMAIGVVAGGAGVGLAPQASADTGTIEYEVSLDMNECGVMYLGTTGTCIRSLQTWMNWATGSNLAIDSEYGPATLAVVQGFQSRHHIKPTGHFGVHSRAALVRWYANATFNGAHPPCQANTGKYCDKGEAEDSWGGSDWGPFVACKVVERVNPFAGVFCEVSSF